MNASRSRQSGLIAVFVVVALVMLCGILAFTLDVGHLLVLRGDVQNAADSGALAGAAELQGRAGDVPRARTSACTYANYQRTDRTTVNCDSGGDVDVGWWDATGGPGGTGVFLELSTPPQQVTAVRVRAARDAAHGNRAPAFLSTFVSEGEGGEQLLAASGEFDVRLSPTNRDYPSGAIGYRGGPCSGSCVLPLVVPECALQALGILRCDPLSNIVSLSVTSSDSTVSFRMTPLTSGMPADMLASVTAALDSARTGAGCVTVGPRTALRQVVVDEMNTVAFSSYAAQLGALTGSTFRIPIRSCATGWSGRPAIVGFATASLVSFDSSSVTLQLRCAQTDLGIGACPNYGTFGQPVLVDMAPAPVR